MAPVWGWVCPGNGKTSCMLIGRYAGGAAAVWRWDPQMGVGGWGGEQKHVTHRVLLQGPFPNPGGGEGGSSMYTAQWEQPPTGIVDGWAIGQASTLHSLHLIPHF